MESIVRLESVVVAYGSCIAVDRLDLAVSQGELFGLLGPSGAGKSSTLRVLIGQCRASSGRVTVAGLDLVRDWGRIKPQFGYVPDRENLFDEFTGRRNLELFADLYRVSRNRVVECLDLVGLSEAGDQPACTYSVGMRRKLLLARALLHKPSLLYLDEPTANLDIHSAAVVHRILRVLAAEGTTVLLTTHNMQEVEAVCDRIGILCRGRLVALDTPLALRHRHAELRADVVLSGGQRAVFDLSQEQDRALLARHIAVGEVTSIQTREADLQQVFRNLTGTSCGCENARC